MSDLVLTHRVHIIESPGSKDVLDGRQEGTALFEALRLAGIDAKTYFVINEEALDECLCRIPQEPVAEGTVPVPFLHFSAHGNKDGIALSCGSFVPWKSLGEKLYRLNDALGGLNQQRGSLLVLCMSTCYGLNGTRMKKLGSVAPFAALVGPKEPVGWSHALTAFVTFYHLQIHCDKHASEAVHAMNIAAGIQAERGFSFITWKDLENSQPSA